MGDTLACTCICTCSYTCEHVHALHDISCIYTASILHPLPQTDRQTEIMLPNSHTANFSTARLGAAQRRARRTCARSPPDPRRLFLALVPVAARVLLHCVVLISYICIHQGGLKSEYQIRLILSLKANTVFCIQHVGYSHQATLGIASCLCL